MFATGRGSKEKKEGRVKARQAVYLPTTEYDNLRRSKSLNMLWPIQTSCNTITDSASRDTLDTKMPRCGVCCEGFT